MEYRTEECPLTRYQEPTVLQKPGRSGIGVCWRVPKGLIFPWRRIRLCRGETRDKRGIFLLTVPGGVDSSVDPLPIPGMPGFGPLARPFRGDCDMYHSRSLHERSGESTGCFGATHAEDFFAPFVWAFEDDLCLPDGARCGGTRRSWVPGDLPQWTAQNPEPGAGGNRCRFLPGSYRCLPSGRVGKRPGTTYARGIESRSPRVSCRARPSETEGLRFPGMCPICKERGDHDR